MRTRPLPMLELIRVEQVWNRGLHNAFTDLCAFAGSYWLVFREASNHVSDDGAVIVLNSTDAQDWQLAAEITLQGVDLRDPKIVPTPDGRLLITCAGVLYSEQGRPHQSLLFFSSDGLHWSDPLRVGRLRDWIWRTRFIDGVGYAVAYHTSDEATTLYKLSGDEFQLWVDPLLSKACHGLGYPNEHDLFALDSHRMGCLLRRDADTATAQLGIAHHPFTEWQWRDLGVRIGGPVVQRLALGEGDAALLCGLRLYDPVRTSLCWLDIDTATLSEVISLPSGGDTSYPGLVQIDGRILCSYYSSHEGKAAIYLAELQLADASG